MIETVRSHAPSELSLSAVTLAEILYGIERPPAKNRERRQRIQRITSLLQLHPFDGRAAQEYPVVRSDLEHRGQPISERDTQIAAVALARRLTLVAHNGREFRRIAKLQVQDWA